jgi:hypothetical protein
MHSSIRISPPSMPLLALGFDLGAHRLTWIARTIFYQGQDEVSVHL